MSKFYFVNIVDMIDPSGEPAGPFDTREQVVDLVKGMVLDRSFYLHDDLPVIIEVRENGVPLLEAIPRHEIQPNNYRKAKQFP